MRDPRDDPLAGEERRSSLVARPSGIGSDANLEEPLRGLGVLLGSRPGRHAPAGGVAEGLGGKRILSGGEDLLDPAVNVTSGRPLTRISTSLSASSSHRRDLLAGRGADDQIIETADESDPLATLEVRALGTVDLGGHPGACEGSLEAELVELGLGPWRSAHRGPRSARR